MEVQPQLVLLQKTLLYIEGIGRQLYPQLDLWKTAKPFLEDWIKDQIGIPAILRAVKEGAVLGGETAGAAGAFTTVCASTNYCSTVSINSSPI